MTVETAHGARGARALGRPCGAPGARGARGAWPPWRQYGVPGCPCASFGAPGRPWGPPGDRVGRARRKNPSDPNVEGVRRATIMKRVHMARKRGERIPVTFDEKGQPEGKHDQVKDIIWKETVTSFTVDGSFRTACIKSCGEAARNFRHDLYKTFVEGFLTEESVWTRPQKVIDNYPNIEEEDWVKFVQYRTFSQFQQLSDRGSEIRTNNEYSSRGGRDGYRKLDQEKMGLDGELKDPACQKASELRVEIEELKALVRGLCANKDVAPSVDPNNVPTVDQHNSVKASCSAQGKQHGDSDPPTMAVDSQECKLYIIDEVQGGQVLVAFGRAWLESLPTDTVHGIPLGEGNVRVSINVPKLKKAPLPIPTYEATTVEDAINGFIAWPKTLVELDTSMNKASRGPSHVADPESGKKKNAKESLEKKPSTLGQSSMRQGNQIEVPIPYTIMTFEMPVFLSYEDIYEFINLQEISANCTLVYMRYLEELCRINGQADKFAFVSPTLISPVRTDTEDAGMRDRADNLISFLRDAPKGRLYLVPHNRGRHWVWESLTHGMTSSFILILFERRNGKILRR
ncbi:hypothetical protein TIFTF001_050806 [Ficus carica]|uniref:DUF8039 domain-containing protein n=1 Tax=Ficus carica TaxID=3494 RepID=A0AA88A164_FICCA|nr:hypothetical protein TIFTF001_050806 [Ficus carica]